MFTADFEERAALIALLRERPNGATWHHIAQSVLSHGSVRDAREALSPPALFESIEQISYLRDAREDLARWLDAGLSFWTIIDDNYPARLRDIHEAPPFLFARGSKGRNDVAVSVVGSRNASEHGLRMATSISQTLVSMGISVMAGLAAGIDTAAHQAAIESGGRTIAVIGTGVFKAYPAVNAQLQEKIAQEGLLLSQFWPDASPRRQSFPMRNAVMSGIGHATVVVEAGEHSGARIQARKAVEHGRPVILTDLVVNSTEWGKLLLTQPDVHLAASSEDVREIVQDLVDRPKQLEKALQETVI